MTQIDSSLAAAIDQLKAGNIAQALSLVETRLLSAPDDLAALGLGALCAARLGDSRRAIALQQRHLALTPDDSAVRFNLALALAQSGEAAGAREVARHHGNHARLARLAGYLHQQCGDLAAAVDSYHVALTGNPSDWETWNNLANCAAALGGNAEAVEAYEKAINTHPSQAPVEVFINLVRVLTAAEDRTRRLVATREALRRFPDNPQVRLEHGLALAASGDMAAAERHLASAIVVGDPRGEARIELALLYEHLNRLDDLDSLVNAMAAEIASPEIDFLEALRLRRRGNFAAAQEHAARIPDTINPVRTAQLRAEIADRLGDTDEAFAQYTRMNAASLAEHPAPAGQTYRQRVEAATLAMEPLSALSGSLTDNASADPIFIVGSPRSGTTLLDTLLGSLPELHVSEELPMLAQIEAEFPGLERSADAGLVSRARARYRKLATRYGGELGDRWLVDKMPLHMARMPLIARMFPQAKIVLVERHPADAVLSCFMANFTLNHAMRSYADLDEAARTYHAIFASWRRATEILRLDHQAVRYERMIADLETEMHNLLAFLGLAWRDSVLDNQSAAAERGHVRTASYAQIGQPLYARAVGRWERYAPHLAPVMPVLEPWIDWLGYEQVGKR